MLPGECLQELVGTCGRLCETVVHLVRDFAALLFLGRYELPDQVLQPVLTLGQLSVEPRVLQGACTLVCEADQGLLTTLKKTRTTLNAWCELSGKDLRGRCPFARVGLLTDP